MSSVGGHAGRLQNAGAGTGAGRSGSAFRRSLINLQDPNMIRTPKGASSLDLETPLRCNVNWKTQEMITALPYNMKAFNLTRNGINNPLPRFEVTGFPSKPCRRKKRS